MADERRTEVVDTVPDESPDTVATPEGDNEYTPEEPLPTKEPDITRPRGDGPHSEMPLRDAQS